MRKLKLKELNRKTVEEYKTVEKLPYVVVLDNIRSAMNVGSVFRTSDAFLVKKMYLTGITAQPPHREILKTAIGSTESVDWEYYSTVEECIQELKTLGYKIFGIEQTTHSIELSTIEIMQNESIALIFGNEVNGISDSILKELDGAIEIPQYGTKHSLNISVCAGICLWSFFQKLANRNR